MAGHGVAILGGTGALGRGLALRWARAGVDLVIGSREGARAVAAAGEFAAATGGAIAGMDNAAAAAAADILVLSVPFAHHAALLATIRPHAAGKIVIDTTVPLRPPRVSTVTLPPGGSAAQAAQAYLGDRTRVVAAFHNVAADRLADLDQVPDCDVLVCADDEAARSEVVHLVERAGLRGLHAGPLANAVAAEALTAVLIFINRRYKVHGAGLRITGLAGGRPAG